MNPHNPKWTLTLGVEVLMDSQIIKEKFQGLEIIGLKISLHYSKALETQMSEMGSHDPFGYLKYKLWPKEELVVKVPI